MVSAGIDFSQESIHYVSHNVLHSKAAVKEGYHPKNVNLAAFQITCPGLQVFFTDENCRADASLTIPTSNCQIQSVVLSIDGGPDVSINAGSTLFSNALDTFFIGTDTFNIVWNVTDDCGVSVTCTQEIHIRDTIQPSIACPQDVRVGNRRDMKRGLRSEEYPVIVGDVVVEDNCTELEMISITNNQNGMENASDDYPLGLTQVWYTATDASGNSTQCSMSVVVFDNMPPVINCPDTLYTDCLLPQPYNNIYEFLRARGGVEDETLLDSASFRFIRDTIADSLCVNKKVIHRFYTVRDTSSNSDTCFQVLIVNDIKPPVASCKDITVYLDDLGMASISADSLDNGSTDNCEGALTFSTIPVRLSFGCDDITQDMPLTYTFVVSDPCGNTATCETHITVIDPYSFTEADITWPDEDVYFDGCNVAVPPVSDTGSPVLNNSVCSMTAATYKDQFFDHPIYCRYVRRTWSVIDWRQYRLNTQGSPGRWVFVQNIYVTNSEAPVISMPSCENRIICTPDNDCSANVTFTAEGNDDCIPVQIDWSYQVDLNNDGTIDMTGDGSSCTGAYEQGTHRLIWEAKDGCSNVSTCSFEFIVRDCKSPTAIAHLGLAINLQAGMGMAEMNAQALNNLSIDNCTPSSQLKFSFSSDVNDTLRVFDCQNIGRRSLELWVTDLANNQTRTQTYVDVQDNFGVCTSGNQMSIAGKIYTEEGVTLPDVKVWLEGAEISRSLSTDDDGKYCFEKLPVYNDYYITSAKSDLPMEGVSTLDLVHIHRHILGLDPIDTPYRLMASDINNSKSLTASDLTELRKMILGLQDKFENNSAWRFVNANYVFTDEASPWNIEEALIYESLDAHMLSSDFIAVKIGDVDGSVSQNRLQNTQIRQSPVILHMEDKKIESHVWESLPVTITSDELLMGIQWTLELSDDIEELVVEPGLFSVTENNLGYISRGKKRYLTFSYHEPTAFSLREGDILFHIHILTSKESYASHLLDLSHEITASECYDDSFVTVRLGLSIDNRSHKGEFMAAISQNYPNPFKDHTLLKVTTPVDEEVSLSIFDPAGMRMFHSVFPVSVGDNFIKISDDMLNHRSGKFIVKIKSSQFNDIVQMIRIE